MTEIEEKLRTVRTALAKHGLAAIRFRGVDWFSWITGGASSVVILTSEAGIADVLVTAQGAWVLTNAIERDRLASEELSPAARAAFQLESVPWQTPEALDRFVRERAGAGPIASDRPNWDVASSALDERALPGELLSAKRRLLPAELDRYRALGREAAQAMGQVLREARPDWTEQRLAGAGASALWERGIHPTLVLAAGEDRASRIRHPLPTGAQLDRKAMLVFCARRHGLYACFTRWVYFSEPTAQELADRDALARIEARALKASSPGARLGQVYEELACAYRDEGKAGEIDRHHQGGTTGYLSREVVARPGTAELIEDSTAFAWNPSLPGAKLEDTILVRGGKTETLSFDPDWPTFTLAGVPRPDYLVQA